MNHALWLEATEGGIWDAISSRQALSVYLVVILALITILVLVVLIAASKTNRSIKKIGENGRRFNTLCRIDEEMKKYKSPSFNDNLSLENICEEFKSFAAHKLGLYYETEDIRSFIAGLGVSKFVIMQGLSGTGKTSLATALGEFLQNKSTVVSVQPMWKERSDMIGYFNEFTKKFSEGALLKKLYEARYTDEIYVVVLDEMNIARVEYYFADFLSQLELNPSNRYLDVVSDTWDDDPELLEGGRLLLPENVWFIGTANNDDSTFAISDKVYDRAMIMNLDKKADAFMPEDGNPVKLSYSHLTKLFDDAVNSFTINEEILAKLDKIDQYLTDELHIGYGNRIKKQMLSFIPIYVACGGDEISAFDDFYTKKIMRKIEVLSPSALRFAVDELSDRVNEEFGTEEMPKLRATLSRIKKSVM